MKQFVVLEVSVCGFFGGWELEVYDRAVGEKGGTEALAIAPANGIDDGRSFVWRGGMGEEYKARENKKKGKVKEVGIVF